MTNYGFISFNKETPKRSAQLRQKTIIIKSPTKCLQLEHSLLIALINLAHGAAAGAGAREKRLRGVSPAAGSGSNTVHRGWEHGGAKLPEASCCRRAGPSQPAESDGTVFPQLHK